MLIDMAKIPLVADRFIDQRILPSLPEGTERDIFRWVSAGTLALTGTAVLNPYIPLMKAQGIVTEDGKIDTDKARRFLDAAFQKQPTLTCPPIFGRKISFDQSDAKALVDLMEGA